MTHASVFSGIGGPEVAATMLGWQNLFHCEINPFGRQVLDYWYPEAESYEDITTTDFTKWRGRVDVLTGGFPCQPFSYAGQRRGATDDRYLWPYMFRCIDQIRPAWVVAENVAGILTMVEQGEVSQVASAQALFDEGDPVRGQYRLRETFTLQRICDDLESHGYSVQPMLIPACGVGALHRRDRVFIIGHRVDADTDTERLRGWSEEDRRERTDNEAQQRRELQREPEGQSGSGTTTDPSEQQSGRMQSRQSEYRLPKQEQSGRIGGEDDSRRTAPHADGDRGCEVDEHLEPELADGAEPVSNGRQRNVADTCHAGLQEARPEQPTAGHRGFGVRTGEWVERFGRGEEIGSRWQNFPSVSPVHRGNDGLPFPVDRLALPFSKWRTEALKAYGNAIVPQVMYEIFRAIEQVSQQTP